MTSGLQISQKLSVATFIERFGDPLVVYLECLGFDDKFELLGISTSLNKISHWSKALSILQRKTELQKK